MMKLLMLWRPECDKQIFIDKFQSDVKDHTNFEYKLITTHEDLENENLNEYTSICILVELGWGSSSENENHNFMGYDVAFEVIDKWAYNTYPNIQFVSLFPQEDLYDYLTDKYKYFAKAFTHHLVSELDKVQLQTIPKRKWEYLKRFLLTASGRLEGIVHSLKQDLNKAKTKENKFVLLQETKEKVKAVEDILTQEIKEILNKEAEDDSIQDHLEKLLAALNSLSNSIANKKTEYQGTKENIILVEDDVTYANILKEQLSVYFEVKHYRNGQEAIDELKTNDGYQAIITDLELIKENSKIDQPVQGVDLLEFADQNAKHLVQRVVSSLPRKAISVLTALNVKHILYKSSLNFYGFNEEFYHWVMELKEEIEFKSKFNTLRGPSNTFWDDIITDENGKKKNAGFRKFYYDFRLIDPEGFKEMYRRIFDQVLIANSNVVNDLNITHNIGVNYKNLMKIFHVEEDDNINKAKIYLEKILLLRLIWLSHYRNKERVILRDETSDKAFELKWFWGIQESNGYNYKIKIPLNSIFSYLGLSCSKPSVSKASASNICQNYSFTFGTNELFPEERNFLIMNKRELNISLDNIVEKHGCFLEDFQWICVYEFKQLKSSSTLKKAISKYICEDYFEYNIDYVEKLLIILNSQKNNNEYSDIFKSVKENWNEEILEMSNDQESIYYPNDDIKRLVEHLLE